MSASVYPILPGLSYGVSRTPMWKTDVKATPSGREFRGSQMTSPLYRYALVYEFLRDTAAYQELRLLWGFFNSMRGSYDSFLFSDPDDNTATAQAFGSGDGVTTAFQLTRALGGNAEPIYDTASAPAISVNSVLKTLTTDYTINATGGVTFVVAPGAGLALTWTGTYYWRCRFLTDELSFEKFMQALWEAKKVEFVTVKP